MIYVLKIVLNCIFAKDRLTKCIELGKKLSVENYNKELAALSKDKYLKRIVEKTKNNDKLDHQAYIDAWGKIEKESEQLKNKSKVS